MVRVLDPTILMSALPFLFFGDVDLKIYVIMHHSAPNAIVSSKKVFVNGIAATSAPFGHFKGMMQLWTH